MAEEKRERLGSRIGFIFLSAGCAIGCGNIWKFPWMVGRNGGGAFVFLYLVCLVILGLPVMTMELSVGRASRRSILQMYNVLEKKGQRWHIFGPIGFIGNVCLMAFYTVVTGWMFNYFIRFLTGRNSDIGFVKMISNPGENVAYLSVAVGLCFLILCFNLQGGLERITKYLMSALFLLMIILAGYSLTFKGAGEGIRFYLLPDFSKINGSVLVAAMNQAFFTLSLGIGSMAIFGSYIGKDRALLGESVHIALLDTFVAIMAGLIIFPSCMTYGIEVSAGPGLLFDAMATAFNMMAGGRFWGTLFFLFMVFAAFSTELAVCENIIAGFREMTGISRIKSSIICGIGVFLISLTTALGFSVLHFQPFAQGSVWLDFWDFIVSVNLLPIGSLIVALFCSFKIGWGWDNFVKEANTGSGIKVKSWMKPVFRYIVPAGIVIIYIYGLATFPWR